MSEREREYPKMANIRLQSIIASSLRQKIIQHVLCLCLKRNIYSRIFSRSPFNHLIKHPIFILMLDPSPTTSAGVNFQPMIGFAFVFVLFRATCPPLFFTFNSKSSERRLKSARVSLMFHQKSSLSETPTRVSSF